MADPGQYERVFGQLAIHLVRQNARGVEVVDQGVFMSVSWQSEGVQHQTCFREDDLAQLQSGTRLPLGSNTNPITLLAALGHVLDEGGINVATVNQEPDGFAVTGSLGGHYQRERYTYQELRQIPVSPLPQPEPFAPVDAGCPSPLGTWPAARPPALPGLQTSPIMRRLLALEQSRLR